MFHQHHQRLKKLILGCVAATMFLHAGKQVDANHNVYQQVAPSSVLVFVRKSDRTGHGTGVVIDREKRIVLTAAHVVTDATEIEVLFADQRKGRVIGSLDHYAQDLDRHVAVAKILEIDLHRDLALLQLERLPEKVPAIRLASESPLPGESVYVVGNAAFNLGGVFGIFQGTIRGVYKRSLDGLTVIDSTIASNEGDSGGPVVNAQGRLVGIVHVGTKGGESPENSLFRNKQLTDHSVDLSEIRAVLKSAGVAEYAPVVKQESGFDFSAFALDDSFAVRDSYGRMVGIKPTVYTETVTPEPVQSVLDDTVSFGLDRERKPLVDLHSDPFVDSFFFDAMRQLEEIRQKEGNESHSAK